MELTAAEAWGRILERARPMLPEQTFQMWLAATEPLALTQDQLAVATKNEFAAEWIENHYGEILADVANRVFGRPVKILFEAKPEERERRDAEYGGSSLSSDFTRRAPTPDPRARSQGTLAEAGAGGGANGPPTTVHGRAVMVGAPLNERYSFDRFVVGTNNQLSAAACRAVGEAPARMYNPLFIYGGVGLGKTHLMHAIAHLALEREAARRVAYISSERFTNELISSIQEGRMSQFRYRYREIDLLLIDDVQFLGEKERTQEEFFHTFNALHDAKRQIVMTSDRPPKEIPGLEERLVSRFEGGLVTDIKPPDFETRVAILRKKAEDDSLALSDEVLDFIARNCRSNVRELEGAIIKLLAFSSLTRREITIELADEALGGVLGGTAIIDLDPERIRDVVAQAFSVSVDALVSKKRTKDLTVPRQIAMYLMREMLDIPLVEIGKRFGGRDHSTVIHSINKVEDGLTNDDAFRARIDGLKAELLP